MNAQDRSDSVVVRVNALTEPSAEQPVDATDTDEVQLTVERPQAEGGLASELAVALELLRSKGFVVPSLAEALAIAGDNNDSISRDETADTAGYVDWQESFDSSTYIAANASRFEQEEREQNERIHRAVLLAQGIAADVRGVILRHVRFTPRLADAYAGTLALWVMHTHVYQVQRITPYLLITSPTAGAGKSAALEVLTSMAYRAVMMVNPTAPVLRTVASNDHTVLVDEVDELAKTRDFTSIANAGYRRGGTVYRIKDGELTKYDVFAPKVFAGIAREDLPIRGATLDRCIQISIERVSQHEAPEPFDAELLAARLEEIRNRLESWATRASTLLRGAAPIMPELPTIRAVEIWKPLVGIGDLLGGEWAASVRGWATTIESQKDSAPDANVRLIQDVHEVLENWMQANPYVKVIAVEELVRLRNELQTRQLTEQLTPVQFGKRLGRFGIKSQPVKSIRVYKICDAGGVLLSEWDDLFARYC
jgi:hypothetical protein